MKKTLLRGIITVMMSISFTVTSFAMPTTGVKNEEVTITILGTSDVHGRFMPWEYAPDTASTSGSLTQISTLVKKVRGENPNTILVDCGDSIQDNYVETLIDDEENPMVVGMNAMGYDVWVMGNHEYNFNRLQRQKVIDAFKGAALSGNVYNTDGSRYLPAYQIIEKAGVKVGIIGITTPMIKTFEAETGNLDGLVVNDTITEIQKAIDEIENKVDVIVGVVHMGEANENNIPGTGVIDLANACPELDAIVAGHMHLNVSSNTVNGVLITEPYKYGQALSQIDLSFKKDGQKYELVNKKAQTLPVKGVESDKELEAKLQSFHEKLQAKVNVPIGKLVGDNLVQEDEIKGISSVYTEPTALMNLFFDVAKFYSHADVIALCTDNEKAQITAGDIRIKDIAKNYTYTGGEITVYEVTGKDLKTYMEWSADYFNTLKDGDVTISYNPARRNSKYSTDDLFGGVNFKMDLTKESGHRIVDLTLENGTPIKDDTKLTLGMNAYRMEQFVKEGGIFAGKTFKSIYDSKQVFGEDEGTIRNITIKYIKEELKGELKGNFTKNWEIIGIDKTSKAYQTVKQLINEGSISLPLSEDGKYTNVASINVKNVSALSQEVQKKIKEALN